MALTYKLISSNTLSSPTGSVTFSSIPATYTDLVFRATIRTTNGFARNILEFVFNGSTSSVYSVVGLKGEGTTLSSPQSANLTAIGEIPANGGASTSNTFGSLEMYISNYTASASTAKDVKPISVFAVQEQASATSNDVTQLASLCRISNAAISTILVRPNDGSNFATGSSFFLYGIKNS